MGVITGGNSKESKKLRFIENVLQPCKKKVKKQKVTVRQEHPVKEEARKQSVTIRQGSGRLERANFEARLALATEA